MARIFFDNSATTRIDPRVLKAMLPYYETKYGNPSSLHQFGAEAHDALEDARAKTAKAIGAEPEEIYFTSGGTESDNIAVQGIAFANRKNGNHIITSSIEHHAILRTCVFLESQGFHVTYLPVDHEGMVDAKKVLSAITKETILISIMAANNEIGTIQPVRSIGRIAKEHGIPFHTDAVQAATKMPLDANKDNIDLLSLSAHKFHGPKGVGALYLRKGLAVRPLTYGGGQERGVRPSTENVPGAVGLGTAIDLSLREMDGAVRRMTAIRERLIDGTLASVDRSRLNGHRTKRLCNNVNMRFDDVEGEALVLDLDYKGIAASTGSACSARSSEASHVLKAIGLSSVDSRGALRLSLSKMNNQKEADYFLEAIVEAVGKVAGDGAIEGAEDRQGGRVSMAYNKKVMDHFMNPRNVGEMKDADGEGKAANTVDGDIVVVRFKVADNKIVEVKHQVFGCAAAIAGSSAFSEMIMGKDIDEALKISKQDVADYLDGLPESKIACSILGPEALKDAVRNMEHRHRRD